MWTEVLAKLKVYWLGAICTSLWLTSCFDTDMIACKGDGTDPVAGGSYVLLSVSLQHDNGPVVSRSPQAGEDGDGRQAGLFHENDIENLCVFVYNSPDSINAPATTPITGSAYVDAIGFTAPGVESPVYTSAPILIENFLAKKNDHFVAVANMGDLTKEVTTLGQLRDYLVENPWNAATDFKDYTAFTMASEADSRMTMVKNGVELGSAENPIEVAIPLERTAARIDFVLPTGAQAEATDYGMKYGVTAADASHTVADVYLTHARIVNAMQQPTYLLKRTAESVDTRIFDYLGKETVDANGLADNYVIEPTTALKQREPADAQLAAWFGDTRFALYEASATGGFTEADKVRTRSADGTTGFDTGLSNCDFEEADHPYYVLGYVNENTMAPECTNAENATGVVLRAKYVPRKVYRDYAIQGAADGETGSAVGHKELVLDEAFEGGTFWRYRPSRVDFSEDVCLYFSNKEAAAEYAAAHPEDVAVITEYADGVCYYNVWMRHAENGDEAEIGPMEFGIVRNNIYQILVKSVTGPGSAEPEPHGPENIESVIYVRPWNVRVQPEIVI